MTKCQRTHSLFKQWCVGLNAYRNTQVVFFATNSQREAVRLAVVFFSIPIDFLAPLGIRSIGLVAIYVTDLTICIHKSTSVLRAEVTMARSHFQPIRNLLRYVVVKRLQTKHEMTEQTNGFNCTIFATKPRRKPTSQAIILFRKRTVL